MWPETALFDVPFVVVDLETTGGSPETDRVTEIGAVRVQGGEVTGELQSLVDPGRPIPLGVVRLTGITQSMVAGLPAVEAVLPTFLEFARGATLVAHNARFDTAFLGAALARLDYPPLTQPVVCTAALARRLVREDVRDCRLATLARYFATRTEPVHRALADARATVEVLHALLERAGSFGVSTLGDLLEFVRSSDLAAFRSRETLTDDLPRAPGVYRFVSGSGEVLYVGKATDLRARVRRYFGGDDRRWVAQMVRHTDRVEHRVCPTPLEAEVREARMLRDRPPRYNRRGARRRPQVWVKLTTERWPRLSVVSAPRDDAATHLGPVSRRAALTLIDALHDAAPVRQCSERIAVRRPRPACLLAQIDRCLSPCDGTAGAQAYDGAVEAVRAALRGDLSRVAPALLARLHRYRGEQRFERAAVARDRLAALVRAATHVRSALALHDAGCLVLSRPVRDGRTEVVALRHGRLVATARSDREEIATAVTRLAERAGARRGRIVQPEELRLLGSWLRLRHIRVEYCDGVYAEPVAGGHVLATLSGLLEVARDERPARRLHDKQLQRPVGKVADSDAAHTLEASYPGPDDGEVAAPGKPR